MTSAYLEQLGRATLAPVYAPKGGTQDNYQEVSPQLEEGLNKQIDDQNTALRQSFRDLGEYYNSMHDKRAKIPEQLLKLTKSGWDFSRDVNAWNKFNTEMKAFEKTITPGKLINELKQKGLTVPESTDSEVIDEQAKDKAIDINKGTRVLIANSTDDPEVKEKIQAFDFKTRYDNQTTLDVQRNFPVYMTEVANLTKVDMAEFGQSGTKTLEQANTQAEYKYIYGKLTYQYLYAHRDIIGGSNGRFKRNLVIPILERRNNNLLEEGMKYAQAIDEQAIRDRGEDLKLNLKLRGPGYFVDHLSIYKDSYDGSYLNARKNSADQVGQFAEAGVFNRGEIEEIITTPFEAHDGTMQTIEKYWPKEARTMMKGVQSFETAEMKSIEDDRTANIKGVSATVIEKLDSEGPVTAQRVQEAIATVRKQTGATLEEIPESLKSYQYAGFQDDVDLETVLKARFSRNPNSVTEKDIRSFQSPDKRIAWRKLISQSGGGKDDRQKWLDRAADTHFDNKLGDPGRDTSWHHTRERINAEYASAYDKVMSESGDHAAATYAGRLAVNQLLKDDLDGKVDLGKLQEVPENTQMLNTVVKTKLAIAADPTLINSDKVWPGEEPYLVQAAKAYNGDGGSITPHFYYKFPELKINGKVLAEHRLKSVGWIKDGEAIIPETAELKAKELEKIRFGAPSSTYQLTQEQSDIGWMLETIQEPAAKDGDGYDYITRDGEPVELEKPLSEHTVDEVIGLLNTNHDSFGVYGISADGLREIILNNPIDLTDKFDKETQDLLVLARLRQKAQQSQQYMTVDAQYRRLVNINRKDRDAFLKIVGDLPPYLQLENLLPAVATEMVQQTLQ